MSDIPRLLESSANSKIYVDFDYTLFRSSSTEEFLSLGRPRFIATTLLRATGALRPWSLVGREDAARVLRDPIRSWILLILMPWTLWLFKQRAPSIFAQLKNDELVRMISGVDPDRVVIVSLGYEFLIRHLLRQTPLSKSRIVASSFRHPASMRKTGKLARLLELDMCPVRKVDIVITDSLDDEDLLASVDNAFLIDPEIAKTRTTLESAYVPLQYTARVKRSTQFVVKQIFLEELPVVLLATALYQPFAPTIWMGAALLFVAFLVAYEIGYAENDSIGYRNELKPKLSSNYEEHKDTSLEPAAWFWVIGLTISGVLALGPDIATVTLERLSLDIDGSKFGKLMAIAFLWLAIVVLGRGVFFVFNRLSMTWRVFAYLPLHFVKYFALTVLLPSQPVGYVLLFAQIVRTWSLYAIRRCNGDIEMIASQTVRLAFFVLFLVGLELTLDAGIFSDWRTWVILSWCIVRATPEAMRKLFSRKGLRNGLRT